MKRVEVTETFSCAEAGVAARLRCGRRCPGDAVRREVSTAQSASDVLQFRPTDLGSAVGAFGVDSAVTVVTGMLAALHRTAVGGGGHGFQDGPDDRGTDGGGAGQPPPCSRG